MLKETNGIVQMLSAKWIDCSGVLVAVSPTAKCICMLSNPCCVNRMKSKGMRASRRGEVLVEGNKYATYCMDNVPIMSDYKIIFLNGKFNGVCAYYNICMDPDLGVGWAALCHVAGG